MYLDIYLLKNQVKIFKTFLHKNFLWHDKKFDVLQSYFLMLVISIYFKFFLTKIAEDISTALRDYFKPVPDEVITGPNLMEKTENFSENPSLDYSIGQINEGKDQVDILIQSLSKILVLLEKSTIFGSEKLDDMSSLATELKSIGSHSFQQRVSKGNV